MRRGGPSGLETAGWALIGVLAMAASATAADIFVNTTVDTNDGNCTLTCSLRDAVMIANSNPGTDTIFVPAGVYELTIAGGGFAESGDLDIFEDVNIEGAGAGVTVIHNTLDEYVFEIRNGPLLQLFDLTIEEGVAAKAVLAALYLWRCVVQDTVSTPLQTGATVFGVDSTILVVDSIVRGNVQSDLGGGIYISEDSILWVLRSTIADNLGNFAGGAVSCADSSVTFTNATVTENRLFNGTAGGFYGDNCEVLITGSTLAGNLQNDLELSTSTVTVRNTYIGSVCPLGTADQVTSEGGNVGAPSCGFNHPSDIGFAGGTAILLPLGDYGGYTPTMPPSGVGFNPLVDNLGADLNCLTEDQRGVERPQDGGGVTIACDTGAVERTHVFIDGFESGDTSAWSSSVP